jgi:hypothetical protein
MPATTTTAARQLLAIYPRVTDRDRWLLAHLHVHRVLTTDQIHRLAFTAVRTCQIRLAQLRDLGLLERFRFAQPGGGSQPWHWTLGLAGARFQAAATNQPPPTERAWREQILRLSASQHLPHQVLVNEFFVRLHHHTRHHPNTALQRWWSEHETAARFLGIHPDGHGIWSDGNRAAGFHLECDRGTEPLHRLVDKLPAYQRINQAGGPNYPILFWLTSPSREANLQDLLRRQPPGVPVATATHRDHPARPVWLPIHGWQRTHLTDLPSDHGRPTAANPNWSNGHFDVTSQHSRPMKVEL